MQDNLYCIIMAGGKGSRLWPRSCKEKPKQFLDLVGVGKTMLQLTYDRFRNICPPERIIVVTMDQFKGMVKDQLPELPVGNILCEPFRKNTSACIFFACAYVKQLCENAVTIVSPADHLILNEEMFLRSAQTAINYASSHNELVTIGVKAYKPETAFGYIQLGEPIGQEYPQLFKVKTFTEKPNEEMAQVFYECGEFCWNTGVFAWQIKTIEEAIKLHLPNIYKQFEPLDSLPISHWTPEAVQQVYTEFDSISIDYGVLERAQNIVVVQTQAVWSDLGSWDPIYEQALHDNSGNAIVGGSVTLKNSRNCLVDMHGGNVCIVDGLNDYLVIEANGVLLICPREKSDLITEYHALKNAITK